MAGTTAVLALPYTTGTDKVIAGDDAIKALADKLELLLAPTTAAITLGANFTNSGGTSAWKSGKVGYVQVNILAGAAIAIGAVVFTIPAGYRPPAATFTTLFADLINTSAASTVRLDINPTTGAATIAQAVSSGQTLRGGFMVPIA